MTNPYFPESFQPEAWRRGDT
ncbi:hypothetical protein ECEC4448_2790, partial [Escherichia coli EC4448]